MSRSAIELGIATLRALRADLQDGFLTDLRLEVETEVGSDLLETAAVFLRDKQFGPAGLLAGVVLERAVKQICTRHGPPIPLIDGTGKPVHLDTLIDRLKAAGLYQQPTAAECKAWLAIRNKCAHGEFGDVRPEQVERMVDGVRHFLVLYLH